MTVLSCFRRAFSLSVACAFGAVLTIGLSSHSVLAQKAKKAGSQPSKTQPGKGANSSDKGEWLIRWNKGEVSLEEFEAAYRRMNDKQPYVTTLDSLRDFLNVYADYRLKLEEAKELGVDQDPKIKNEIRGYRNMLAGPYILEKEITEPAVHKLWERRQTEVHAGHFLAAFRNPNNPEDTLRAYNRALKAIERMKNGEPLAAVVLTDADMEMQLTKDPVKMRDEALRIGADSMKRKYSWEGSDDRATAKTGGDLGWFTGGMTVRQFEDAVYGLKPGEFTQQPVRTRFGYHVIQLFETRPRVEGVKVSHILVQIPKAVADVGVDTLPFYHKADSLLQLLRSGKASFEQLAKDNSDDKPTAKNGGDMNFINHEERRAEGPFDEAAYALKDGQLSNIVRTSFGYHIIRRNGTIPSKSYDEEKENLKQIYKKYFYNEDKDRQITQLKNQYQLHVDSSTVDYFVKHVDSTRTSIDSAWDHNLTSGDRSKTVYTLGGEAWTMGNLIDSLTSQPGLPLARQPLYDYINKHVEEHALDIAAKDIGRKYPEFEQIMKDYENGIMLFELENKRVWTQVVPDSAKEYQFYMNHKAKFMWPERVDISEIFVKNDSLARSLYKRIINGENFDSLAAKYTERPGFKEKAGHWGLMMKDENELATRSFNFVTEEVKEPFNFQSGFSIVRLNRREPIRPKTFEEARQEVASQYQDERASELRHDWIMELRKKYDRKLNLGLIDAKWKINQKSKSTGALTSPGER